MVEAWPANSLASCSANESKHPCVGLQFRKGLSKLPLLCWLTQDYLQGLEIGRDFAAGFEDSVEDRGGHA